jgi:CBS domain-containing protein
MDVGSIMTPLPVSVSPDSRLDQATELMDEHGIRHLPVVENGRVVGIVADRDLLSRTGWRPARDGRPPEHLPNDHRPIALSEVMHPPTQTLSPGDSLQTAARGIARHGVGCLAVVQEDVLIGILTETDLLLALAAQNGSDKALARDLMPRALRTIDADVPLDEALEACAAEALDHLPVLARGELVGMLSSRDLARAQGRGAAGDTPVLELMSDKPETIEAGSSACSAAVLMAEAKIGAVPVLEGGTLIGMLSVTDLIDYAQDALPQTP